MAPLEQEQPERERLLARLRRYPVARYPVQHATTLFHLASLQVHDGEVTPALSALHKARDLFAAAGMRLERAKSTNMLGVALREAGRLPEADEAFSTAAEEFAALAQPVEAAAAAYNLGLVRRDSGDLDAAYTAWSRARQSFHEAGHPAQAAAAAREHGASLLTSGQVAAALPLLEQAVALAERAGDLPGLGAAANALGVALLAAEDPAAAVTAFRSAAGAFPRSLRPADHAMAKANLALAHERADDPARARLAARQALAIPAVDGPVRTQARELLARLPDPARPDLLTVLDAEPIDRWSAVVREEVLRWSTAPPAQRREAVGDFVDGLLARPGETYDLAESLLSVLLELPPGPYADMVAAVVEASGSRAREETERVQAIMRSAMVRFAIPQWQRLAASFDAAATRAGQRAAWT